MTELESITAPFFPLAQLGEFEVVGASQLPEDYQVLLAHDDHMTVTVEAFFNSLVDVRVLDVRNEGDFYRRTSLLACQSTGQIVQFGCVCIDLRALSDAVRREIESRRTPLGRVLIRHNVLRRVELRRLWRVKPGPVLCEHLHIQPAGQPALTVGGVSDADYTESSKPPSQETPSTNAREGTGEVTRRQYIYGRTARIVVESQPAIQLLEIVRV